MNGFRLSSLLEKWFIFLAAACSCSILGCSSEEPLPTHDEVPLFFPHEFEDAGKLWIKSGDPTDSEIKQLAAFFKSHPSAAEGTLVQGDPTVYHAKPGAIRFYWGRLGAELPEWLYVQFAGRKATLEEGTGAPLEFGY